jgi:hypothetical protein
MSEDAGPRNEERQCADANGDHRFSYEEEPQSRQKHGICAIAPKDLLVEAMTATRRWQPHC